MRSAVRARVRPWLIALALACVTQNTPQAQTPPLVAGDGPQQLLARLQKALVERNTAAFASLFAPAVPPDDVLAHQTEMMTSDAVRIVVRERDRVAITGVAPGSGYRIAVEVFTESGDSAAIVTAGLDVLAPENGSLAEWTVSRTSGVSTVHGLYRLRLNEQPYAARNFTVSAPDLTVTLRSGTVFWVDSPEGVTGAVLLGDGEMRFTPGPSSERGQLRLFAGTEALSTPFDSAFIRLNPAAQPETASLTRTASSDARLLRRAQELMERESAKSFLVDLRDVSTQAWHVIPRPDDFVAEVRTNDYGTLTYTRAAAQPEDISLSRRDRQLTIALYQSPASLERNGRFYSDDAQREYDVLDYDIDASIIPSRGFLRARARIALRARSSLNTLMLRLADALTVSDISSSSEGPLGFIRLRNQNAVIVRLPRMLPAGGALTLTVNYSGPIESQALENGGLQNVNVDPTFTIAETHLLQSTASLWYPQNPYTDYATATIRVSLPEGYACVASGERVQETSPLLARADSGGPRSPTPFVFRANQPVRYLAVLVSRFVRADARSTPLAANAEEGIAAGSLALTIDAQPLLRPRARELAEPMDDIVRFYAGLLGGAPYPSTTLALVEAELPGGHSPPYFVMLNSPMTTTGITWRNDPAAFQGFPEFFLAHELAHQWWGHAVGWKNYREQWISEGFAQYFAALYAERARGERTFHDMLRQFRRWSLDESSRGPVHLGQRLGQIDGGPRVLRAIVYNKGAAVLHMLRRLVGDEAFFRGLRRFHREFLFQTAGTGDLQRAMEAESKQPLERFFDKWILGTAIPRIAVQSAIAPGTVTVRLTQRDEQVFDIPVTVTLIHTDGSLTDHVVVMNEKTVERRIEATKPVRQVRINRDSAALAEFDS